MKLSIIYVPVLAVVVSCFANAQTKATPEQRYVQAMAVLTSSVSVQTDRNDALELLRSSADENYAPAQTALGTYYSHSGFAPRDMGKAVEWFAKAAEHGDWIAQMALGRIYFTGDGVPQDSSKARQWLFRAADSGDGVSAYFLGLLYDGRLGGLTDHAEAARWYRQSAETGNPYAQEKLANLLFKGLGVAQDQKEAYIWLLVAVEFGNSAAALRVNSIETDLGMNTAKATRESAAELRRQILANRSKNPCSGWPGQYDLRPTPPPMSYLQVCEKKP